MGSEVVTLALLAAAKRIAELQAKAAGSAAIHPSTPSGQIPPYAKPNTRKRKRKVGAKKGHRGSRRPTPERIDRQEEHRLPCCPDCGGALHRCNRKRTRTIEDLLEETRTEVTEHSIYRDYCPTCKKHVEPVVPDALPKASLGHRLVSLTAWLHYGLGVTVNQIVDILGYHLQTRLSPGGLIAMWHRLAELLQAWYLEIAEQARHSAVLHADETGWRVSGTLHWLWCFASPTACYYMIDRSRGSPALQKFFIEAFEGVLVRDFWAAYDAVCDNHQGCLVHLLRELEKVDRHNRSAAWRAFAKKLRRLIRDGLRLRKRKGYSPRKYASRIRRIHGRLRALAEGSYRDADAKRLAKRLSKYRDSLFTFLERLDVPSDNNFAERQIRPAVIIRKNSQSNRSATGAQTQAILMSVYRTLKLRGHNPVDVIVEALRTYLKTGQLPPLPEPVAAND
jgi:transposase